MEPVSHEARPAQRKRACARGHHLILCHVSLQEFY